MTMKLIGTFTNVAISDFNMISYSTVCPTSKFTIIGNCWSDSDKVTPRYPLRQATCLVARLVPNVVEQSEIWTGRVAAHPPIRGP